MKTLLSCTLTVMVLLFPGPQKNRGGSPAQNQSPVQPTDPMLIRSQSGQDAKSPLALLYGNISWVNWGKSQPTSMYDYGEERPRGTLCAAFSPDGKTIVAGEDHRTVLWNVETGQVVKVLRLSRDLTRSLCYNPEDSFFAAASGKSIVLWDAHSLSAYDTLSEIGTVYDMGFLRGGRYMYTVSDSAGYGRNLRLWDYQEGILIKQFREKFHNVFSASVSPDGRFLLLGVDIEIHGPDKQSYSTLLWDIAADSIVQRHQHDMQKPLCVRFSPDGRYFASGCEYIETKWGEFNDTTVRVWDVSSGQCVVSVTNHRTSVKEIAFSPRGDRIASISDDGYVDIHALRSDAQIQVSARSVKPSAPLAFSRDGRFLLSGAPGDKAALWDAEAGTLLKTFDPKLRRGHDDMVSAVAYSKDGRLVASSDLSGKVLVWRASDGTKVWSLNAGENYVHALSFSSDSKILASAARSLIRLWNMSSGRVIMELRGHASASEKKANSVEGCAFSADDKRLVSCAWDGDIRLWDLHSGKCIRIFRDTMTWASRLALPVYSVAFGPGDSTIIGGYDRRLGIWNTANGARLGMFLDSSPSPKSTMTDFYRVCPTKDGERVISFVRGQCWIWDIASGSVIRKILLDQCEHAATLSPDERFVASGHVGGATKVWELASVNLVAQFSDFDDAPDEMVFSPDGTHVFSGTYDGSVVMWNVPLLSR